ncbi:VOC family protein [Halospeciosus flavus]|uniref:VOC family protein n=1 Tax=Halospeciosus flavus TaxID=3032283 RepID=A0ABD5Z794_9EURY|nr:VOC family protein [Halospeciosus flavus]
MVPTNDESNDSFALSDRARIGRVALRVAALDDVLPFYRDVVGLSPLGQGTDSRSTRATRGDTVDLGVERGDETADETLLVLRETPDVPARGPAEAGLFHLAIRVPDRAALGAVLRRAREHDVAPTGASDHLVSEALYFRDPAGNGVEVYRDRPREAWPRTDDGRVEMDTRPLDLDDLRRTAEGGESADETLPGGTDVGHVHLEVTDLDRAESFYGDALGLRVRDRFGDAACFLAAGDYHHHVGLNTWNGRSEPSGEHLGLDWFEFVLPDAETLGTVRDRLRDGGYSVESVGDAVETVDPDQIRVRLTVADTPPRDD